MKNTPLKNLIVIAGIALFLNGCASTPPLTEADRTFEKIVEAPGFTKDQIYNAARIWIAQNFKSAKSVIEMDSKEDGIIVGNGIIPYPSSGLESVAKDGWKVPFSMRIDIKDQKFRVSFFNIMLSIPPSGTGTGRTSEFPVRRQSDMDAIKPVLLKFCDEILASLNTNKAKSDW